MKLRIKNWQQFQHFKDRCPPWIKLYKDLLDDPYWHDLDGESAKILIMLWLVASEDCEKEGSLPDLRRLSFRLRLTESTLKLHLQTLSHWLIHDDISTISHQYQDDAPETETETEAETEGEGEYCATEDHAAQDDASDKILEADKDGLVYKSKKGKTLKGKTLAAFNVFWEAFAYKKDRACAADAFLSVYSPILHDEIIAGALRAASERPSFLEKGLTPKMAQGWLSGRRWEDESLQRPTSDNTPEYMQGVQ